MVGDDALVAGEALFCAKNDGRDAPTNTEKEISLAEILKKIAHRYEGSL